MYQTLGNGNKRKAQESPNHMGFLSWVVFIWWTILKIAVSLFVFLFMVGIVWGIIQYLVH